MIATELVTSVMFVNARAAIAAARAAVVEAGGVKVGLTGLFTVYEDPQHREDLLANIQKLKDQGAQVIVACFHWGFENDYTPEGDQVALAHAAIDAGAHLVIGHHPHVVQGVEVYQGRYIVYSLGNFCFGGNYSPPDYDAMIVKAKATLPGEERDAILYDAEELLYGEGGFPVAPLYFYTQLYCKDASIKNVGFTSLGYFFFQYATKD